MNVRHDVPLALVYQAEALHQHLKQALAELGARVVYESAAAAYDAGSLEASGAEVVVINLDPEVDQEFEALGDLLADASRRVVFNDGEVSSRLEGWDLARWSRHLAAKILGVDTVDPPRPEGAVAVPIRVKASAPVYPGASAPSETFELHGHELAAALSADTGRSIERTRAALVTEQEPVRVQLEEVSGEPRYDIDPAELTMHLPDAGAGVASDVPTLELPTPDLDAIPTAPARTDTPTVELAFEPTAPPSRNEAPTLEFAFDATLTTPGSETPTLELPAPAMPETSTERAAPDRAEEASPGSDDAGIDFELGALPDFPDLDADASPARLPTLEEVPAVESGVDADLEAALRAFDSMDAAAAAAPKEDVPDLELLLLKAAESEDERKKGSLGRPQAVDFNPKPVARAETRPAAEAPKAPSAPAAAKPTPAPTPRPAPEAPAARPAAATRTLADLEKALSGLSLEPLDDTPAPAAPAAAPTPAAPKSPSPAPTASSKLDEFDFSGFSLEPIDDDGAPPPPAAPTSGRASFAVDTPAVAPAPKVAAPAAPSTPAAVEDDGLSLEGFDFEFDENTEIRTDSIVRLGSEAAIADMTVDLDAELDSLLNEEAREAASADGPVRNVWVLGASIGGPDAVREFLAAIPANTPALFLLAQHMGADFLDLMVQQLTKATALRVRTVEDGATVRHGEVVVVPLSERLLVDAAGAVRVTAMPDISPYSPSIDRALMDVADRFGARAGAIIFSGMAHDAIEGAKYLAARGGTVWAQDPSTCVVASMVEGARDAGVVAFLGSPSALAKHFLEHIRA